VLVATATLALGCAPESTASTSVQPTAGAEPGVTIDEGSPAAKEYALALTQARHTGSSGSHASSSEAPFGAGITPPPGGKHGAHRPKHGPGPGGGTSAGAGTPATPTLPAAVARAARSTTSGGSGSLLALLGGGVAILILGGLGGVVLRHSRRPPSHA
jgi:hypothetical protein